MSLPRPEAGLVVCYSYLWHSEHARGRQEGVKDRPCAIILAVSDMKAGRDRVWLLPVTHLAPTDLEAAVEIPGVVKRRLGLDGERSWVVLSEWNECLWLSPDLRRTSRRKNDPSPTAFCRQSSLIICGGVSWTWSTGAKRVASRGPSRSGHRNFKSDRGPPGPHHESEPAWRP